MESYKFPEIRTIHDVLPHIEGKDEFIIVDKPNGLTIIDYMYQTPDTFDNEVARECRGLIFDKQGKLIRRAYHKFFNLNEHEFVGADKIMLDNALLFEKLDGSMVTAFEVDGSIRYATRMGITDHAMRAEKFAATRPEYHEFDKEMLEHGYTPIYEWLDSSEPIVVQHDTDNLILTGLRHLETGEYANYETLVMWADAHNIPVCGAKEAWVGDVSEVAGVIRELEGVEGIVVRDANGHMIKIKGEWYVNLHRAKDRMRHPAQFMLMVLDNQLDDLYALLPEKELVEYKNREADIQQAYVELLNYLKFTCMDVVMSGISRKEFALEHAPNLDSFTKQMMFKFYDIKAFDAQLVKENLIKCLTNTKQRDSIVTMINSISNDLNQQEVA